MYDVKVEWMTHCGNAPSLVVTGPPYPTLDEFVFKKKALTDRDIMYLGVNGDFARFFYYNERNQTGFCGSKYILKMEDGTQDTLTGPWSSNAGAINQQFDVDLIEVRYNSPAWRDIHQAMPVSALMDYLPDAITLVKEKHYGYVPTIKGLTPTLSKKEIRDGKYQETIYSRKSEGNKFQAWPKATATS